MTRPEEEKGTESPKSFIQSVGEAFESVLQKMPVLTIPPNMPMNPDSPIYTPPEVTLTPSEEEKMAEQALKEAQITNTLRERIAQSEKTKTSVPTNLESSFTELPLSDTTNISMMQRVLNTARSWFIGSASTTSEHISKSAEKVRELGSTGEKVTVLAAHNAAQKVHETGNKMADKGDQLAEHLAHMAHDQSNKSNPVPITAPRSEHVTTVDSIITGTEEAIENSMEKLKHVFSR